MLTSILFFSTALYDDLTVPTTTNLYINCISPKVTEYTDFDWLSTAQCSTSTFSHSSFVSFFRWTRRCSAKSLVSTAPWPVWRSCGPEQTRSAAGRPTEPLWLSWHGKMRRKPWLHLMVQLTLKNRFDLKVLIAGLSFNHFHSALSVLLLTLTVMVGLCFVFQAKLLWGLKWSWVGVNQLAFHLSLSTHQWGWGPLRHPHLGCLSMLNQGIASAMTSPSRWACQKGISTR